MKFRILIGHRSAHTKVLVTVYLRPHHVEDGAPALLHAQLDVPVRADPAGSVIVDWAQGTTDCCYPLPLSTQGHLKLPHVVESLRLGDDGTAAVVITLGCLSIHHGLVGSVQSA